MSVQIKEQQDVKVLISFLRKKELEEKEKELSRMKLENFDATSLVRSIYNFIEEFRDKFEGGVGGRAAQYAVLDRLLKVYRDSYVNIPPITSKTGNIDKH